MKRSLSGGLMPRTRTWVIVGVGFVMVGIIAAVSVVTDVAMMILVGAFFLSVVVGMVIRWARAKRGSRIRSAFGPMMGAAETYQRLYTTQPGLGASIDYAIREQQATEADDLSSQDR